ncbi:MAG: DUF4411 family protein [Gammaproteobacteria bacterium]|nr:DUF4411 family protein [Gammaproteobacteria bacterium]
MYLLDANTLIDAKRDYYPIARVPEFWDWLVFQGLSGNIKIPIEMYEEFSDTRDKIGQMDELASWAEAKDVKDALLLGEEAEQDLVARITYGGYVANPTDDELIKMGRDPFLLSYALRDLTNRCVVTTESSKPSRQGANRHVPDVCATFGIRCINSFRMIRELDFSTGWNGP